MTSKQYLKLRRENFGGIVFNPQNGCELQLDNELFDSFIDGAINNKTEEVYSHLSINRKKIIHKEFFVTEKFSHKHSFQIFNSPVLADINITNKCNLHCSHCYIDSSKEGNHMTYSDFQVALEACHESGMFQIALGGGEPTLHPDFSKILKEIRGKNIVPNLTSNGKNLSWRTVYSVAKYCGAIALSLEGIHENFEKNRNFPYKDFQKSIKKIKAARIKLVFQITLSCANIDSIEEILLELLQYKPYGILFLAYKPQGRGKHLGHELSRVPIEKMNEKIKSIFKILKGKTKLGFDCCSTPSLVHSIKSKSFVGCSASRYSLAIMPNLDVLPCSFLDRDAKRDNLKNKNLAEIWRGEEFNKFRLNIAKKINSRICSNCSSADICLGGCPVFNLTNC